ncbi:unnamed protein product [Trichobilharzia szidati]|nr:unnamed protein product [Trichobilharzia szidati]
MNNMAKSSIQEINIMQTDYPQIAAISMKEAQKSIFDKKRNEKSFAFKTTYAVAISYDSTVLTESRMNSVQNLEAIW